MQVTLNIDANLAGSVKEVFDALKPEDKRQLALAVMEKFMAEPHQAERQQCEVTLIAAMRERGTEVYADGFGYTKCTSLTDDKIRSTREFRDRMTEYKSTRDVMIAEITTLTIQTYRAEVKRLVESDPQIAAMRETVLVKIKEDFPKYVHDAMAAWFVQGLTNMQEGMMKALMQASSAENFAKEITDRLRLHQ